MKVCLSNSCPVGSSTHEHGLFLGGLIPYVSFVHVDGHGGEGQGGEEDS